MLSYFESKTLNGTVTVETEEGGMEQVVSLYGMKSENGEISFNNYVVNRTLYDLHRAEVEGEISDFIEMVKNLIVD